MSSLKAGDVVRIEVSGFGIACEDEGKWVEIIDKAYYFGEEGYIIKEYYDSKLLTEPDGEGWWIVGEDSFGDNPMILLNTVEEQALVKSTEHCPVNKPIHYQLTEDGFEVKDLMKILLNRIEQSDIGFSHFQSSCYKEAMQYLLRFMLKNGYEDLEKAQVYLTEVIENRKEIK